VAQDGGLRSVQECGVQGEPHLKITTPRGGKYGAFDRNPRRSASAAFIRSSVSVLGKGSRSEAEEYIVSWARELPDKHRSVAVHVGGDARAASSVELNGHFIISRAGLLRSRTTSMSCSGLAALVAIEFRSSSCFVAARFAAGYLLENPSGWSKRTCAILGWVGGDRWRCLPVRLVAAGASARVPASAPLRWSSGRMRGTKGTGTLQGQ
jgi:hypothetical protein